VKKTVRGVCKILSETPELQSLNVSLVDFMGTGSDDFADVGSDPSMEIKSYSHVLQPFALLRNVRVVDLHGVRPRYGRYLKDIMAGCTPVDHLPKMFDALEHFAGPFDCCEEDLQRAVDAMEEDDAETFKHIRAEIIKRVHVRMENALGHLFDHDAKNEVKEDKGVAVGGGLVK